MIDFIPKNRTTLVIYGTILLGIVYLITYIIFKLNPRIPVLINSTPQNQAKKVVLESIPTFDFDRPINIADVVITSVPSLTWALSQSKSTNITANHLPDFQPSTTYTIYLTWKTKPLASIEFSTLSAQVDPQLLQNMKDELARDYPLSRFTPYKTSNYRVVYASPMTFEITLKNSNITAPEALEEVKIWVTKNGGDLASHKFNVVTE